MDSGQGGRTALIVVAAGVGLDLVACLIGLPGELRSGLAGVPALFLKDLYEMTERIAAQRRLARPPSTEPVKLPNLVISPLYVARVSATSSR